jgi:hypothetical protein
MYVQRLGRSRSFSRGCLLKVKDRWIVGKRARVGGRDCRLGIFDRLLGIVSLLQQVFFYWRVKFVVDCKMGSRGRCRLRAVDLWLADAFVAKQAGPTLSNDAIIRLELHQETAVLKNEARPTS